MAPDLPLLGGYWGQILFGFLVLGYATLSLYWYIPRMLRRTPEGWCYRLSLAGQNVALLGLVWTGLSLFYSWEGSAAGRGLVTWALAGGFCVGVAVFASRAGAWRAQLAEKGAILSRGRRLPPWVYLALTLAVIAGSVVEIYVPQMSFVSAALVPALGGFLLGCGLLMWHWAANQERERSGPVELIWPVARPGPTRRAT